MAYYYYLHFLSLLLPLVAVAALNRPAGCKSRCGNVDIHFPFGIGRGCALNDNFDVSCSTSTTPAIPYLTNLRNRSQIIEIRISTSQVLVRYPYLAGSRYEKDKDEDEDEEEEEEEEEEERDEDEGSPAESPQAHDEGEHSEHHDEDWRAVETWTMAINLTQTPYTLSERNSITVVGCDDFVRIDGINSEVFAGCTSICNENTTDGNCPADGSSGNGCCQYPIPKGQAYLSLKFTDIHEHSRAVLEKRLFRWGYAFVGEKQKRRFSYKLTGLNNRTAFKIQHPGAISRPLVMDWRIGNQNCTPELMNSTLYACKSYNSHCVNVSQGPGGYTCHCNKGYEGNPYLINGCMDVDECNKTRPSVCKSPSHCKNTVGGYECRCSIGYRYSNDRGCIPSTWIHASIGVCSGIGFILILAACFFLRKIFQKTHDKNRKRKFFRHNGGLLLQQQESGGVFARTNLFTADELEKATDHFNEARILGQGAHGTVYKGILSDGRNVAVKKAKLLDQNELQQFINEMIILSQINHKHIVKLFGCCLETEVPLLVYEFVPNGTLYNLIHDSTIEFPITWKMRLKIASDIAGAIAYLHSASSVPIYHRDIKSSNILLDEKYVVKVSDFGGSRLVPVDHTHLTTALMGTYGYLDPEFFQSGQFTEKSDVYSFGVVMVELLTSKKPISFDQEHDERNLAARFVSSMEAQDVEKLFDDQVLKGDKEEVMAVAKLAMRCLHLQRRLRPTMRMVVSELDIIIKANMGQIVEENGDYIPKPLGQEPKVMTLSSFDYTWSMSTADGPSSSTADHPLMKNRD